MHAPRTSWWLSGLIAAIVVLVLLPRCDRPDAPRAGLERPVYSVAGEVPERGKPQVVRELRIDEAGSPWRVLSGGASIEVREGVLPGAEDEPESSEGSGQRHHVQVLEGSGTQRVRIRGPFEPGSFDRMDVRMGASGDWVLRVQVRNGQEVLLDERKRFNNAGWRRPVFDLPTGHIKGKITDITLLASGKATRFELVAVGLLRRPPASWLPDPREAPRLVRIKGEERRAIGMHSSLVLSARVQESDPDAVVAFDYGWPLRVQRPGARPVLELRLRHGDVEELVWSRELSADEGWCSARVSLDRPAGGPTELAFSLAQAGEEAVPIALGAPRVFVPSEDAPTVILITSDTHRADYLAAAKFGVDVQTPTLDALAGRGVLFRDCLSAANTTNPSHATLLTGLPPTLTGIVKNGIVLGDAARTLAEAFEEGGYECWAAVSAIHLGSGESGLGQGFDRVTAPAVPQRDSSETIGFLERWLPDAQGAPLFIWLHSFDVHGPYEPPAEYASLYWDAELDPYDERLPAPLEREVPSWDRGVRDLAYPEAMYRGEVSYLDGLLGELLAGPRFADAIIAVTSDHGENIARTGRTLFDHMGLSMETLAVPLVIAWPGADGGRVVERGVEQRNVGRTLLDLAGLEGSRFAGTTVLEEWADEPRFALQNQGGSASVRLGKWLLILHLKPRELDTSGVPVYHHVAQLFDVETDRDCTVDRASEEFARVQRMRGRLVEWLLLSPEAGATLAAGEAEGLEEDLAALGYTQGNEPVSERWIDPECECDVCERYR